MVVAYPAVREVGEAETSWRPLRYSYFPPIRCHFVRPHPRPLSLPRRWQVGRVGRAGRGESSMAIEADSEAVGLMKSLPPKPTNRPQTPASPSAGSTTNEPPPTLGEEGATRQYRKPRQ